MKNKGNKIFKTLLSIIMSFLIIFIAAMFARSITSNILPKNSKIAIFVNDYLDMMMQKVDSIAVNLKMKRNSVSQYQVDLISQSITDYVGYSLSQTSDLATSYNPNKKTSDLNLDEYKKSYYKMTLENPYLKSMTIFNTDGKMTLNLYLAGNKSWPIELNKNLIENIKNKGSYVIHATNENSFYVMQYMKNKYGEFVVSTRNDYSYISDIALYYQVADKTLYVSDSESSMYTVKDAEASKNIDNISSVISRFAFYKKQPSFEVGENVGLSVALVGKEYPNYFELIVLGITAFFIVIFQCAIRGLAHFFVYLTQAHKKRLDDIHVPSSEEIPLIDEDIIKKELPKSMSYENTKEPEEVFHKISDIVEEEKEEETEIKEEIEVAVLEDTNTSAIINTVFKSNSSMKLVEKAEKENLSELEETTVKNNSLEEEYIESNTVVDNSTMDNIINKEKTEEIYYNNSKKEDILFNKKENDTIDFKEENDKNTHNETEDVFSAFDRMLSSIISKAEQDARETLAKKS